MVIKVNDMYQAQKQRADGLQAQNRELCNTIAALEREVEAYKVAARQLKGIPASVGVPEPIEGFAARPQDIMPAVLDMALRIEGLEKQLTALGKVQELASKLVSIANQETECYAILTVDVDALKEALAAGEAG